MVKHGHRQAATPAAVNTKVERIGETHEGVDNMYDVASEIIVHLGVDAKVMLSENIYNVI